jgi:hypothetical protein
MLPVILGGAGAVAGGVYLAKKYKPKWLPPWLSSLLLGSSTPPGKMPPPGVLSGPATGPSLAQQVRDDGRAKAAAAALLAYLKASGNASTPALSGLVYNFQSIHNSDPMAVLVGGAKNLPATGVYDAQTASVLTVYTGTPYPPTPGAPKAPIVTVAQEIAAPTFVASSAATTGFTLYMWLTNNASDRSSAALKQLVGDFQASANTDPMFPGPKSAIGKNPKFPKALRTDGVYDQATANALSIEAPDGKAIWP